MFLYAAVDAPWVKPEAWRSLGLLIAAFVTPLELIATIFAFLARDTVAAAALGLFSASWLVGGLLTMNAKAGILDPGFGYFLLAFTIVIVLLGAAAFLGKPLIGTLLIVSSVRGVLVATTQLGGGAGWTRAAGWLALAIFCIAMYGGLAFLLEESLGRAVLPIGRRGGSREAMEGGLA